jgi:L-seryl-tRNA(Ser) seleniumtransferase
MTYDSEKTAQRFQDQDESRRDLYRMIPSVNDVLLTSECRDLLDAHPRQSLLFATRRVLATLRMEIASGQHTRMSLKQSLAALPDRIANQLNSPRQYSLRLVINATGVILHTNLGRAPLSNAALDHLVEAAQDYCNLELDLETGTRSRRDIHAESLLLRVLNMHPAVGADPEQYGVLIVNNCAAATFLALNSLAEKREVIVSRGELVEIGGGFRIPEILDKSGAILKEVGTTNRTRVADYEGALTSATALILRVHQSNFSIEGFAERPALADLVSLSKRTGIPLFEDQGTGLLSSLETFGIHGESGLQESFHHGVDLVAASGDKLLGGPQCGILAGRKELIDRIRKNPLLRALRVDKLTYAALEATLMDYLTGSPDSIPIYRMLSIPPEELMRRCQQIVSQVESTRLVLDVVPVASLLGGGTAPRATLPSCAVSLRHVSLSAEELSSALRHLDTPIIGRINDDTILLDLRTVHPRFDPDIVSMLAKL